MNKETFKQTYLPLSVSIMARWTTMTFFVPKLLAPATVKHIHKGFFIKQAFLPQQMNQHLNLANAKKAPAVLMECRRLWHFRIGICRKSFDSMRFIAVREQVALSTQRRGLY